jgi:hypothetical protein
VVTVKLTDKEADLIRRNVDGWLDAGQGEGGLTKAEQKALSKLYDQIVTQTKRTDLQKSTS